MTPEQGPRPGFKAPEPGQGTRGPADQDPSGAQPEASPKASAAETAEANKAELLEPTSWPEAPSKRHIPFYVLWQEGTWLFKDGQVIVEAEVSDEGKFSYAIHDFPEQEGPELIQVSGDVKYAGVLARKRAEEMGSVGPGTSFHVYQTIKRGKQEAKVIYHVLPQTELERLQSACSLAAGRVLFDPVGLMLAVFNKGGKGDWQALALHIERSIIVLVGNAREILLARRYLLVSSLDQELPRALGSIDQDLEHVQQEQGIELAGLQWIEALVREPGLELPKTKIRLQPWPLTAFSLGQARVWSALPGLIGLADPGLALWGREERLLRPLERLEGWLYLGLALSGALLILLAWTGWLAKGELEARNKRLDSAIQGLEQELTGYSYRVQGQDQVRDVLELIKRLRIAGQGPGVGKVWNAFLAARPEHWQIDNLGLSFQEGSFLVQASGKVQDNPYLAEQGLRGFKEGLANNGFSIADSDLRLGAEQAEFSISASYPWAEE